MRGIIVLSGGTRCAGEAKLLLSHYTTREGLIGIGSSQALWATNFLHMNDRAEVTYAFGELLAGALDHFASRLPFRFVLRTPLRAQALAAVDDLREKIVATKNYYGNIFVTSFAVGSKDHHERDGIKSLWSEYTGYAGYCLQYDIDDVNDMLKLEGRSRHYGILDLCPVQYGVNHDDAMFKDLVFQLGELMLSGVAEMVPFLGIKPDYDKRWAASHLMEQVLKFSGRHKHPQFEDEREYRIFATPLPYAKHRPMIGTAVPPDIHLAASGKRYITIGDQWDPPLMPKRIIIGPKADRDLSVILGAFTPAPEIHLSNIPIA